MLKQLFLRLPKLFTRGKIRNVVRHKKTAISLVGTATALIILLGLYLMTNPSQRDSLNWAQHLVTDEIQSIELIAMPSSVQERYKRFDPAEFSAVAALLNHARGSYIPDPESVSGGSTTLYIVTQDGVLHQVSNIGNRYLYIDGDAYDAGYSWLSSWEYTMGDSQIPEDFWEITEAKMSADGITISGLCHQLSADMAKAIYEEVGEIMVHTYEGINRIENISVYFRNELEEDGVVYEELTVGADWTTVRKPEDHPLILGMTDALAEMEEPEDIQATQAYIAGFLAEFSAEYNQTERLPTYLRVRITGSSEYELLCSPYTESGEIIWVPMAAYYGENYKEDAAARRTLGREMAVENLQK